MRGKVLSRMKRTCLLGLMIISVTSLTACGKSEKVESSSSSKESQPLATSSITETSSSVVEETTANDEKAELKNALKDKESLEWFGDVRNDKTGNWRLAQYSSADSLETFAADYYHAFFESDDEIHAVINRSLNVTGRVSVIMDDTLDITLFDYVDKEEHDADMLFTGTLLKEYWVTISTGEIEEIQ